jgi:hypothetical protein
MTTSLVDWAAEARTWSAESLAMAELMFPSAAEVVLAEEKDGD